MGTCFHGHVILVCATDIEACLELYLRGNSQAFGQGHELLIDGEKNLPGHYVYEECCEVPIPLEWEWGLPNLEATSFVANKDVYVVIPQALEDVVSLFILSGGDPLKSLTEDGGDIDKDRKLQEEDREMLGGLMFMISDPIYMHEPKELAKPQSPASALGNRLEHQSDSGPVPTADSDADTVGRSC
jgi:hypothetical protein